jgi:hypothetical protein
MLPWIPFIKRASKLKAWNTAFRQTTVKLPSPGVLLFILGRALIATITRLGRTVIACALLTVSTTSLFPVAGVLNLIHWGLNRRLIVGTSVSSGAGHWIVAGQITHEDCEFLQNIIQI